MGPVQDGERACDARAGIVPNSLGSRLTKRLRTLPRPAVRARSRSRSGVTSFARMPRTYPAATGRRHGLDAGLPCAAPDRPRRSDRRAPGSATWAPSRSTAAASCRSCRSRRAGSRCSSAPPRTGSVRADPGGGRASARRGSAAPQATSRAGSAAAAAGPGPAGRAARPAAGARPVAAGRRPARPPTPAAPRAPPAGRSLRAARTPAPGSSGRAPWVGPRRGRDARGRRVAARRPRVLGLRCGEPAAVRRLRATPSRTSPCPLIFRSRR